MRREWLDPGTHVTSVGFNAAGREVDDATVAEALVVVESRAAALAPHPGGATDLLDPLPPGSSPATSRELGEIISGARPGPHRPRPDHALQVGGVAVQDAAAVGLVLQNVDV